MADLSARGRPVVAKKDKLRLRRIKLEIMQMQIGMERDSISIEELEAQIEAKKINIEKVTLAVSTKEEEYTTLDKELKDNG